MSLAGRVFRSFVGAPTLWRARHGPRFNVLVVGVFMRGKPNLAADIAAALRSSRHRVDQAWASVGEGDFAVAAMLPWTRLEVEVPTPKFVIINRLLAMYDLKNYSHVIVTDDDIEFEPGFLDDFIGLQNHYGFTLAQPARSLQSNVDHAVTLESHARMARRTRFVEIGPLFSIAAAGFSTLIPFDESFYMGWGLDHVWPIALEKQGLTLGVVDRTPVHHRFRPVASTYSISHATEHMASVLAEHQQISPVDKLRPLQTHWW